MVYKYDFLVIGAGVAGMSYALKVARANKGRVCMICKTSLDEANTSFAQGGVASVTNLELDNFEKHIEDTMIAGDYISDPKAVEQVVRMAPEQIRELVNWGVNFDKASDGKFDLHREGGHSEFRILHHKDDTQRKYSKEERLAVIQYYLENGQNIKKTIRDLGYPSRQALRQWLKEEVPEDYHPCQRNHANVYFSQSQKEQAVIDFCAKVGSGEQIAAKYGTSRESLYVWKKKLLPKEIPKQMAKKNDPLFVGTSNRAKGQRLSEPSISTIIKERFKAAGYDSDKLTAHSLRHTGVTALLRANGGNIQQAQHFARHKSMNTTLIYAHNIDFEDDNSSELVHDYLFGQNTENAKKAVADAVKEMTEEQAAQVLAFIREMGNAQKAV